MKKLGFIILVAASVSSSNTFAESCASIFNGVNVKVSASLESSNSKLLGDYLKIASQLNKEQFKPDVHQTSDILEARKVSFLKRHQVSIQKILDQGEVSLADIAKAKLYLAESVTHELSKPHSYIIIIKDNVYSFDLKTDTYYKIGESNFGFTKSSMVSFLRLGIDGTMLILNDKVFVHPKENKDPAHFKALAESKKLPKELADLYVTHSKEITDVLLHTSITIESLVNAFSFEAKTESGEVVILFALQLQNLKGDMEPTNLYFVSKKGVLESSNQKRWGLLGLSPNMGFDTNSKVKLKMEDGTTLAVDKGVVILSSEAKAMNLLLSMVNVLKDSGTSKFRADFMEKYGKDVMELIAKDTFVESSFNEVIAKLDVIVSERGEKFYVLPTKNGDMYFLIDKNGMGKLSEISVAEHGKSFYTAAGEKIQIGRSVGFLSKSESKRIESDNAQLNAKAFYAKIEVSLQRTLTQEQRDGIDTVMMKIYNLQQRVGPLKNMLQEHLVKIVIEIKADLINKAQLTMRESEEVIKVLF